jgi:hypothetical protein
MTHRPVPLLVLALIGCAARPEPATSIVTCHDAGALPAPLLEAGNVLLFGEIHGSRELPALFGEAVCSAARAGLPVEVGLEHPRGEQASVDAFLASAGDSSDVGALLAAPFWSRTYQDGRSSRATVALLERLRRLSAAGLPVRVFLFDLDPGDDRTARDEKMAENLAAHVRERPEAIVLALTGEVHAWTSLGAPWNPAFRPMGWHLEQAGIRVRSLGRATPAGTVWICTSAATSDCGERETGATTALPSGRAEGIELLPEEAERGYIGLYGVPTLEASPPAVGEPPRGD